MYPRRWDRIRALVACGFNFPLVTDRIRWFTGLFPYRAVIVQPKDGSEIFVEFRLETPHFKADVDVYFTPTKAIESIRLEINIQDAKKEVDKQGQVVV